MSSPFKRNLRSRRARRLYPRTLDGGERSFLPSSETSRDWARALSAVRSRIFLIPRRPLTPSCATEIEGFFNLLYAHLLTLWPTDSPETKNRLSALLPTITSSTTESAAKYRMCVRFRVCPPSPTVLICPYLPPKVYRTSSTHFQDNPRSVSRRTRHSSSLQAQMTSYTSSKFPAATSRSG